MRARLDAGLRGVLTQLPRLVGSALRIAWRADRSRTASAALSTLISAAMATVGLLATQRVLVELFSAGPTPERVRAALPALIGLAVAASVRGTLAIVSGYALNGLTPQVNREAERRLFETTSAVRLEAFDEDSFADDMERAARGTESAIVLVQEVFNLLAGIVGLLAVVVAVVLIHPLLLGALLLATFPHAYASLRAGHERFRTFLAGSARRRRQFVLQRLLAERISAAELRSYGLRGFVLGLYDRVMEAHTRIEMGLARRVTVTTGVGAAVGGVALAGVYALLGALLVDGTIPLAAAATCVVAVQAAQRALSVVTHQADRVFAHGQLFHEYDRFLSRARRHLPVSRTDTVPSLLSEISVVSVSLRYPDRSSPAVDEVTLTVRAGETVAFVGENGSGKSTLAAMLAGLRTPTSGCVRWNGRPLADYDPDALRRRIAVALQDHHRWPFSAATNIALGDLAGEQCRARIESAASMAAAHDMIEQLPYGYETLLDRTFAEGQDLSGGQWQRITAARAFYRDADLLILDEPSSALDPRAEETLFETIRDRHGRRTTILITHRLANVVHADRIFVLHEGALVEQGSHESLMAAGGRYAELFTLHQTVVT
jgi:ATP-binding cassette, subfamily B, bacterial